MSSTVFSPGFYRFIDDMRRANFSAQCMATSLRMSGVPVPKVADGEKGFDLPLGGNWKLSCSFMTRGFVETVLVYNGKISYVKALGYDKIAVHDKKPAVIEEVYRRLRAAYTSGELTVPDEPESDL